MAKSKGRTATRGTAKAARPSAPKTKAKAKAAKRAATKSTTPAKGTTTASKSPVAAAATQSHPVVLAAVAELGPDVVAGLNELGAGGKGGWKHADTPALIGLERWGTALATKDLAAGIAALVMVGQRALPLVAAAAAGKLDDMGVFGMDSDKVIDGAATDVQLRRVARWLATPGKQSAAACHEGLDKTRQLHVWDEDMYPAPDVAYWWATELGQCACAATLAKPIEAADKGSYYGWPPAMSVGRGLVIAARAIRPEAGEDPAQLAALLG